MSCGIVDLEKVKVPLSRKYLSSHKLTEFKVYLVGIISLINFQTTKQRIYQFIVTISTYQNTLFQNPIVMCVCIHVSLWNDIFGTQKKRICSNPATWIT